nr:probable E3 SUMO-protein ligase RNF212 [Nerophis lumbriciformis]
MTNWVCCNVCFHPPSAQIRLAITSCGHVFCSKCAYRGKQGKCLVCNEKCQISALSDKTPPDVKTLFFDIDHTTNEHLLEIVKVLRFQARHSKRLLTHYRERNEKLEEGWLKMKQENQQMANQLKEQHAYISELKHSLQSLKASSMGHGSQGAHGRNEMARIFFLEEARKMVLEEECPTDSMDEKDDVSQDYDEDFEPLVGEEEEDDD